MARYALVADVSPSVWCVVCPMVISQKLRKIDLYLPWNFIKKLNIANSVAAFRSFPDRPVMGKHNRPVTPCPRDIDSP